MNLLNQANSQAEPRSETEDERTKRLKNDLLQIEVDERRLDLDTKRLELEEKRFELDKKRRELN